MANSLFRLRLGTSKKALATANFTKSKNTKNPKNPNQNQTPRNLIPTQKSHFGCLDANEWEVQINGSTVKPYYLHYPIIPTLPNKSYRPQCWIHSFRFLISQSKNLPETKRNSSPLFSQLWTRVCRIPPWASGPPWVQWSALAEKTVPLPNK